MMWKMAECYEDDGNIEKAIDETEKALNLVIVIQNPKFDSYIEYFSSQIERLKAKL